MSRSFLVILLFIALNVEGAEPRRVLLLHSFGHDFEPFTTFSADFRSELARRSPEPLDFFDVALASARFESTDEGVFVDYLSALFRGRRVDLVVPMGGPAARFAQKHRGQLFPETPLLLTCVDQRHIQKSILEEKDAVVAVRQDARPVLEAILRLLPETTNVAVVFGNSPLEKFWTDEFGREIESLTNHVGWESFSQLSFEQMKKRAATLPPHSVMLYGALLVDAEGIPLSSYESLTKLNAAANSPVFGIHDIQLGHGIVGGPLVSVRELARQSAVGAARILGGESPAAIRPPPIPQGTPTYDWRELRRWKIPEDRLPLRSTIKYRVPTTWERYRFAIVAGVSALMLQAGLIVGLVLNLRRRRKAERSLRESEETAHQISGRLITAQEDERKRVARELHDDLNQRLAMLSIEIDLLSHNSRRDDMDAGRRIEELARQVNELSGTVHAISHQLHPATLYHVGLVRAARSLCHEVMRQSGLQVEYIHDDMPNLHPDIALCLYRVLQESLQNAVRHSGATEARVELRREKDAIQMTVSDSGRGFNAESANGGLGLISMQERVRHVRGTLSVASAKGAGTRIEIQIPVSVKRAAVAEMDAREVNEMA